MSTIEQWIPVFSSNTTVTIPYCLKVKVCRYWDCYVAKALQHKDAVIKTLTEMRSAMVEDQIYAEAAEIIKAIKWYNTTTHWIKVSSQEKEDTWLLYYNSSRPERENHICRYDANQTVLSHQWQYALWNEQQILSTEQRCNARSLLLQSVIWYWLS